MKCLVLTREFIAKLEQDKYHKLGYKTMIKPNEGNTEYWVLLYWKEVVR